LGSLSAAIYRFYTWVFFLYYRSLMAPRRADRISAPARVMHTLAIPKLPPFSQSQRLSQVASHRFSQTGPAPLQPRHGCHGYHAWVRNSNPILGGFFHPRRSFDKRFPALHLNRQETMPGGTGFRRERTNQDRAMSMSAATNSLRLGEGSPAHHNDRLYHRRCRCGPAYGRWGTLRPGIGGRCGERLPSPNRNELVAADIDMARSWFVRSLRKPVPPGIVSCRFR